jgi:hypothetical protein
VDPLVLADGRPTEVREPPHFLCCPYYLIALDPEEEREEFYCWRLAHPLDARHETIDFGNNYREWVR